MYSPIFTKIDLEKSLFMSASETKECIQRNKQKNSHFQGHFPLHLDLLLPPLYVDWLEFSAVFLENVDVTFFHRVKLLILKTKWIS